MASRKLRVFSDKDVKTIADTYRHWRTIAKKKKGTYEDIAGFCKSATLEEVQKQDYKLTPGIYVGVEAEEDDGIPFEEKMADLKSQLLAQFKKGEDLKKQIIGNFEKI